MLIPKFFTTLKGYSFSQFRADAIAGIIVGIVALPLAIAFAIASGVSPERGLYTAVIGGFIVSFLGGSRVQIGGPTAAFVVIVYGVVQQYGVDGLLVATMMAGVFLMIMGFARFGSAIKFVPYPVIVGFTSGIAVMIFSSQINDVFGLGISKLPSDFLAKWETYFHNFHHVNYYSLAVCLGSLLLIIGWRKITRRVPGSLIALIVSTLVVYFFKLPVETIGSRFGEMPHGLPAPSLPAFHWNTIQQLLPTSLVIALLAGIEALLSCVVSDGMIGGKHRSNMELVAQGVANIASPLFGGIPVTGAIARTATNINNGGRTPVAGIIHALTLFAIMVFFGRWVAFIPFSCLAAILLIVAYNMSEWRSFRMVLRSPHSDVVVLLITFALTVLIDLTVAIEVGMVLSVFLFIMRMAAVTNVGMITQEFVDQEERDDPNAVSKRQVPDEVEVYEINGPFFFGASYKFLEAVQRFGKKPKIRIIQMRHVPAIDATGLHILKEEYKNMKEQNIVMILSGVHSQPLIALERSDFLEDLGEDNICADIDDALNRARDLLGLPKASRPGPFVPTVKRQEK